MQYISYIRTSTKTQHNGLDAQRNAIERGYNCEVDFWYVNDKFILGHDKPQYEIPFEFITT